MRVDLSRARAAAEAAARAWGVELGEPFPAYASFVAATLDDKVVKSPWEGDDEALHEPDALELWGDDAIPLLDRRGTVLLEERANPGTDLSALDRAEAIAVAVQLGRRLWRPAGAPFRRVDVEIERWLENRPSPLTPLARELFASFTHAEWLVHGDFHHHNILRHGDRFVAIDPKPYLADREYDVYPWLHNPVGHVLSREDAEWKIAQFASAGLDEERIRAWAVIRGAYLMDDPAGIDVLRSLVG
jgi:streptomycin 6-kinase